MGAHDFKLNKMPLFSRKTVNINVLLFAAMKLALVPTSRYNCKLVIPQCLCQVSLGLNGVQMGAHDFKLKKVSPFSRKSVNINASLSAFPKLALVPASRYNCNVNWSYHNDFAKFHYD